MKYTIKFLTAVLLCLAAFSCDSGPNSIVEEPQIFKHINNSSTDYIMGDVNNDGQVNTTDITDLIDYMFIVKGSDKRYDVNDDGKVDINDVTYLIDLLLTENVNNKGTYTVNGVEFNMIYVEGGSYMMGARTSEPGYRIFDKPQHYVILSNYKIGETEVTQELWQAVMGGNPSYFNGDLQRPVENISWYDCQEFITKLNELTGKKFRLPTETEWEYAARGGITHYTNYYYFAGSQTCMDVAWYSANSGGTTHPVKQLRPNEIGIYDMSGNVCEWVQDWYAAYTDDEYQVDPSGPQTGTHKVCRFGSWRSGTIENHISYRHMYEPEYKSNYIGLRLAL